MPRRAANVCTLFLPNYTQTVEGEIKCMHKKPSFFLYLEDVLGGQEVGSCKLLPERLERPLMACPCQHVNAPININMLRVAIVPYTDLLRVLVARTGYNSYGFTKSSIFRKAFTCKKTLYNGYNI